MLPEGVSSIAIRADFWQPQKNERKEELIKYQHQHLLAILFYIIVIKEICSSLTPFCKQNLLLFITPRWQLRRIYFFNHYDVFNEFAFTVQVKHKINSIQILGFIFDNYVCIL